MIGSRHCFAMVCLQEVADDTIQLVDGLKVGKGHMDQPDTRLPDKHRYMRRRNEYRLGSAIAMARGRPPIAVIRFLPVLVSFRVASAADYDAHSFVTARNFDFVLANGND